MISVDTLNTQKEIATQIIAAKADDTLALKRNHKILNDEVQTILSKKTWENAKGIVTQTEKEHGRKTTWAYYVEQVNRYNISQFTEWDGLKAVGRVQTITLKSSKETQETPYYLLSYEDANLFAKSARSHCAVESKLHGTLDVTLA